MEVEQTLFQTEQENLLQARAPVGEIQERDGRGIGILSSQLRFCVDKLAVNIGTKHARSLLAYELLPLREEEEWAVEQGLGILGLSGESQTG